jgi:hypothetical protein
LDRACSGIPLLPLPFAYYKLAFDYHYNPCSMVEMCPLALTASKPPYKLQTTGGEEQ